MSKRFYYDSLSGEQSKIPISELKRMGFGKSVPIVESESSDILLRLRKETNKFIGNRKIQLVRG